MGNPINQPESTQGGESEEKPNNEDGTTVRKPGSKAQGRKRTKSGCLTCRRRRIKCGEERPTCQNCIKSKRQCEGYNQRVVFKDPLNVYRGPSIPVSAHVPFSGPSPTIHQPTQLHHPSGPFPIAPKPHGSFGASLTTPDGTSSSGFPHATTPSIDQNAYGWQQSTEYPPMPAHTSDSSPDKVDRSFVPEPRSGISPEGQIVYVNAADSTSIEHESKNDSTTNPLRKHPLEWYAGPSSAFQSPQEISHYPNSKFPAPQSLHHSYASNTDWKASVIAKNPPESEAPRSLWHELFPDCIQGPKYAQIKQERISIYNTLPIFKKKSVSVSKRPRYSKNLLEDEDDPFDVSDDDLDMEDYNDEVAEDSTSSNHHLRSNDLGVIIAMQAMATQDTRLRSLTTFIDRPDMLSAYIPSPQSSPLRDPMTARIFCHFINVTGPCMSMFERHPANPLLIFQGHPVPKSQQHIWTYTFPTLALQHSDLLHAMLALASLHIAKLQNGPIATSLKHYAYGLRRVAKSVSLPNRRGHPATLAASMLLAYYEVWCADHQKWSNHLLGARMLLREINFTDMTNYIKSLKLQQRQQEQEGQYQSEQGFDGSYDHRNQYAKYTEDVDESLVAVLSGRQLHFDQQGRIVPDSPRADPPYRDYTEKDLETYETQRDLFWWYCKQDAYQSILGGGKLFMDYDLWNQCLPRAPIGRLNATYGTFDHLVLLNGRLATFMNKDLRRKRMAWKAMNARSVFTDSGSQRQASQSSEQSAPQIPSFDGMVPNVREAQPPMGFERRSRDESPQSDASDEMDLEHMKMEAEEEWRDIRNAYAIFEDHFGEDFQSLGSEFSAPIETPFGTALQYRTYGIAGIWMNYYMALICCYRAHPSMPPAAMVAVGIAAPQTAFFANQIGRIAAGIAPDCSRISEVSPGVGAGLLESGTSLFIAGVQYQDGAQRDWVIGRLRDIARLTGWETALAVCVGCETSWVTAAEMGRGPPYQRANKEVKMTDVHFEGSLERRRVDAVLHSLPPNERRLRIESADRVHYALGVMGIEEDLERLEVQEE